MRVGEGKVNGAGSMVAGKGETSVDSRGVEEGEA